ncbi:3-hydroxyacyl-ACP dehydratase FabZ family protein [Streptomyces xantholiticus]|uniref:Hydroxymyristoyl-ACP dehydratase n=1 Tax=Streptomyces xantholiticus TaxID=68285 RepID=A0ABV1UW93_9ACTN|nr:hydroxymyristoyl-ACP dehydratase [Streptomyces peucetius subsp. caesius ATCC 27952]
MTAFDEVLDVVPGKRAVAVRNVPGTLTVFATHFPRFPVLPGVLILDDIVRAARLAAPDVPQGSRWVLAEAQRVRYRHFAEPGDRLEISVTVIEATESAVTFKAAVGVDGRDITTVRQLRLEKSEVAA